MRLKNVFASYMDSLKFFLRAANLFVHVPVVLLDFLLDSIRPVPL